MISEKVSRFEVLFLVISVLASCLVLVFIRLNLNQTSLEASEHFVQQNQYEISNLNSLEIASKLNALTASESVSCVEGFINDQVFVSHKNGLCVSGLLNQVQSIQPTNQPFLRLRIGYRISKPLMWSAFILLLGQLSLIALFFKLYSDKVKIQMAAQERVVSIANQVAHDIRSPLMAFDVALRDLPGLSEERRSLLEQANTRMRAIAEDLLSKSRENRVIAFKLPAATIQERSKIGQFELSRSVLKIVAEKKFSYSGIDISVDSLVSDIHTVGAAPDFERLFSNLIQNAIEAVIDAHDPRVQVAVRQYGNKVQVSVIDNGKGIPQEVLSKIGEEGFSFGKVNGNGLGVALAKRKMKDWQGEFSISSKVDYGTIVTLSLQSKAAKLEVVQ